MWWWLILPGRGGGAGRLIKHQKCGLHSLVFSLNGPSSFALLKFFCPHLHHASQNLAPHLCPHPHSPCLSIICQLLSALSSSQVNFPTIVDRNHALLKLPVSVEVACEPQPFLLAPVTDAGRNGWSGRFRWWCIAPSPDLLQQAGRNGWMVFDPCDGDESHLHLAWTSFCYWKRCAWLDFALSQS